MNKMYFINNYELYCIDDNTITLISKEIHVGMDEIEDKNECTDIGREDLRAWPIP